MLTLDFPDHLEQLGVKLDAAWKRQYGMRRRRRLLVAIAVLAAFVAGGAAVGAGVFKSDAEEEQGILDGHVLFSGSKPTCESRGAAFRCTLEKPPTGMAFYEVDPSASNPKKPAPNEMKRVWDKFLGVKVETVNADKRIDGGCVSISADGRTWDCYLGQSAVEHDIIGPNLLGQYLPQPAAG